MGRKRIPALRAVVNRCEFVLQLRGAVSPVSYVTSLAANFNFALSPRRLLTPSHSTVRHLHNLSIALTSHQNFLRAAQVLSNMRPSSSSSIANSSSGSDDLLQSRSSSSTISSSVPSQITIADSDDLLLDTQHRQMDAVGLRRLSSLSAVAKFAMKLNQIHRIKICATYDEREDGATVYVMNVYLRYVQKGLPPPSLLLGESERQRKKRVQLERDVERPVYQVEHRYSAFRELRRRVMKTVNARDKHRNHQQCAYCSRVKFIDSSTTFPPRVPNRGLVATCTGWRQICTHFRKRQLESFVNQLLRAAKDLSYRTGSSQCERFLVVSQILNSFLSADSMRETENVW